MKKYNKLVCMTLASALSLGLTMAPAGAASVGDPTDCLKGIAYYGDVSQCHMTSAQALAFADKIESTIRGMESRNGSRMKRLVSGEAPGSIHSYAALFDVGGGKPALFFAGGLVPEYNWMDWSKNIRADGCDWSDIGEYGIWEYKNGGLSQLSTSSSGMELTYCSSYIFVDGYKGSDGTTYKGKVYPLGGGVIPSEPSTTAEFSVTGYDSKTYQNIYAYKVDGKEATEEQFKQWTDTWDKGTGEAPMGHQIEGGVGGRIWGMTSATTTAEALRAYAAAKGLPAFAREQSIRVNGQSFWFQTYALKNEAGAETNYVKLRDIASVLQDTSAKFSVDWDGSVVISTGEAYSSNGSEMRTPYSGDRDYEVSASETKVDGTSVRLDAILLKDDAGNGYTYYKLRDLGAALGFTVDWSAEKGITIETEGE